MAKSPKPKPARLTSELRELDRFLAGDTVGEDAMSLSELDGFLAGVIVCPDLIRPSEWVPLVWGSEGPVFDNEKHAQQMLNILMSHYNGIIHQLDQGRFNPIYYVSERDRIMWEIWMDGFDKAMRLRPKTWIALAKPGNQSLRLAVFILARIGDFAITAPQDSIPIENKEMIQDHAPDIIPAQVEIIYHACQEQNALASSGRNRNAPGTAFPFVAASPKVGRNDPCPCGSGKKFKKCCLQ